MGKGLQGEDGVVRGPFPHPPLTPSTTGEQGKDASAELLEERVLDRGFQAQDTLGKEGGGRGEGRMEKDEEPMRKQ